MTELTAWARRKLGVALGSQGAANEINSILASVSDVTDIVDGLLTGAGTLFYVSSATGSDSNNGLTPTTAKATTAAALALCTADVGDTIVWLHNHAETIVQAGLAFSVAGVRLISFGDGEQRATFTFGTHVDAKITITAADVVFANALLKCNIDSQVAMISVSATDVKLVNLELREGSAKQCLDHIIVAGSANAADRLHVINCEITSIAAGSNAGITLGVVEDGVKLIGNIIDGDFSDAAIQNPTGTVCTNLLIAYNTARNRQTGDHARQLVSACTGKSFGNNFYADTASAVDDPGSLFCTDESFATAIDQESVGIVPIWPTAAVPAGGASLESVLRDVWDALRNGTGGAEPATDKGIMDYLGVSPAFFVPGLGFGVTKTSDLASASGLDDLFTITGKVAITLLTGEVTTVVGGAATMKLRAKTAIVDLCAATTIDTDADGTMYLFTGVASETLNASVTPVISVAYKTTGGTTPVILGQAGGTETIEHVLDAADTGAVLWTLFYMPLEAGASVAAAA